MKLTKAVFTLALHKGLLPLVIAVEYHQLVSVSIPTIPAYKLDGVSTLYNVEFEKKGMRVWKAYGLGAGRLRTETCSSGDLPSVVMFQANTDRFLGVKRLTRTQQSTEKHENEDHEPKDTDNEPPKASSDGDLFTCPEKGCTKTFMRHSSSGVNRRPMAWALKTSGSGRARFTVKTRNPT